VSEHYLPDWLLKAAQETDAMVRQVTLLLEGAQEASYLRQMVSLLRFNQEAVDTARAAAATAGPSLPSPSELDLALAMDAGMRELFAAVYQQRSALVHGPVGTVSIAAPPGLVAVSDAGMATDTVIVQKESPTNVEMPLDAKTVFLAILWVFAILLPLKIGLLSPDVQTIIRDYLVTVGTALVIHWRVTDTRKR
jgi:hypothetical protein